MQSLASILRACRKQQRSAQKLLYHRFYSYGLTVCLHYAQNREEAEEILHDGFLKVFQHIDQFSGKGNFHSWFRSILVRISIDYFRKGQTAGRRADLPFSLASTITENQAILLLEKEDVILILQQLPPRYRMVFNLFVMEDHTHEEIAASLGISVGTSKSNLSRAKEKLRELLKAADVLEH